MLIKWANTKKQRKSSAQAMCTYSCVCSATIIQHIPAIALPFYGIKMQLHLQCQQFKRKRVTSHDGAMFIVNKVVKIVG